MPKLKRPSSKKRTTVVALALASTGLFTGYKVNQYAADPVGEKDCPSAAPEAGAAAQNPAFQPQTVDLNAAPAGMAWAQQGGTINDASCLNRTSVYGIVKIKSIEDVRSALLFAKERKLKVSIAGVRHSMGGQAFFKNALVLDMTDFNQITLDEAGRTITVQSGATWHDIQNVLHPVYAVKAMQSTDIFTVGGSVSVNAHGMDHQAGSVGKTIRSMRVMLADGSIATVSPSENKELFDLVVGGYGLFGVILDVQLDITDNDVYTAGRQIIDYKAFPDLFNNTLNKDPNLGLMYSHLSTGPQSYLREMILYTYTKTDVPDAVKPPLGEVSSVKLRRFVINFSKRGDLPMRLKWFSEKYIEPKLESCSVTRNQAMKDGEACLVARNEPMHDSVPYLRNNLPGETDILQEYYIPRDQFVPFVDELRRITTENDTNVLNASVRVIHKEANVLNYAPTDMYSIVLYINQDTTPDGNARMRAVTQQLIDLTLAHNGTFFLPYQLYYTPEQLRAAYPSIDAFFAAKQRYDPDGLLTNTFYEKYAPAMVAMQ